jgi:hypothetical protein
MKSRAPTSIIPAILFVALATPARLAAQVSGTSPLPYPNAVTDRAIHSKTAMSAPPVNTVFYDPDLGARMVRVSDEITNPFRPNGYLRQKDRDILPPGTEVRKNSTYWPRGEFLWLSDSIQRR